MNPEQENFERLRRLLALKRYEQPPPGYFHAFSREVIVRIRAGERAEDVSGLAGWLAEVSWLQRLWALFESKPMVAGAFGVAVCGLLVTGVVYSENSENVPAVLIGNPGATMPLQEARQSAPEHSLLVGQPSADLSSTAGVSGVQRSPADLFNQIERIPLATQPAGLIVPASF